jgi:hypothetical protein
MSLFQKLSLALTGDREIQTLTPRTQKLRIVFTSDTFDKYHQQTVPDGDVYIHAGSFTHKGILLQCLYNCLDDWKRIRDGEVPNSLKEFNKYLGKLPHKTKLVIGGRHEMGLLDLGKLEKFDIKTILYHCTYLQDSSITVNGVKFYGSPWTEPVASEKERWGFSAPDQSTLQEKVKAVDFDVDVLITNCAPFGTLDLQWTGKLKDPKQPCELLQCKKRHGRFIHTGNEEWYKRTRELYKYGKLSVHLFGSACDDPGYSIVDGVTYVNGCADTKPYLSNPIVFDFNAKYGTCEFYDPEELGPCTMKK